MIIFANAYYLQKHFNNNIDNNILFACLLTRYSNNKLRLVYLKHFNKFTESLTKGSYCILVFNKHSSYVTQLFINYC
jgi:hypothetical protein